MNAHKGIIFISHWIMQSGYVIIKCSEIMPKIVELKSTCVSELT